MLQHLARISLLIMNILLPSLSMAFETSFSAERVLNFPASAPVGFVSFSPLPTYDGPFIEFSNKKISVLRAQGEVVVPEGCFVELELIGGAFQDLEFFSKLPASAIQSLKIQGAKLDQHQLLSISGLTSVIRLAFEDCEFAADTFSEIQGPSSLIALQCYSSRNLETPRMERWVKSLPSLERVFVSPAFTPLALQGLQDHPTLTFVNVTVEDDFPETLIALKKLPALKGIQLGVSPRSNNDLLEGIGQLSQLEWIRWFGGKVDTPTLAELSELPNLKRLDLLHFEAGPGFCEGIESLKQLERLEISTNSELRSERAQLTRSLFQFGASWNCGNASRARILCRQASTSLYENRTYATTG